MNMGESNFISAIIYDKKGNPICYRCGSKLINTEKNKKKLKLGLHKYYCPHCDNKHCPTCKSAIIYSSSLKGFVCINENCSKCWFKNKELIKI